MKRLGVAFGGGGARGFAHVGILRSLRKRGLEPGIVAGTSAGSIAAVLYAAGIPQPTIEAEITDFDWFAGVIDLTATVRNLVNHRRGGLLSNSKLRDTVNRLVGGRTFDDLEIALAVTATDIEGRRRVIFTSRRVAARLRWKELHRILPPPAPSKPGIETIVLSDFGDIGAAVSASCAIPGLFQPVSIGGLALLDGGLTSQVPVDVVRAMGARVTVGVSLGMAYMPDHVTNAASALSGMLATMGVHQLRRSLDLADLGFQIQGIEHRSMLDAHQLDLIALGERDMDARADELRRLVRRKATPLFSRN
jgi:NTE family protein